jgi:hypothetical protein
LYQEVLKIPAVSWGTKTPFASIRRIIYERPEVFFSIKPGLWALEEYRSRLPQHILPAKDTPAKDVQYFDHAYYQGLLVEIGNLRDFTTYVPAQDKNKPFSQTTPGAIAHWTTCPQFTYPEIVERASTIDVIWFNNRRLLHSVFEVEHSTDMHNSLLKFVELQDFCTGFYIVANGVREAELNRKLSYAAFRPIAKRVQFIDYESLSGWYGGETKASQYRP